MKTLYRNLFLLFGLAAIIIMLLTFDMDYRELWLNVRRAGYWFFAVVGIWGVIYFFNALSWFCIIRGDDRPSPVPFRRVFKLTVSGFALNYATPFGLMGGEPYRIMELSPVLGTPRATSCVILYVMMHIFSHLCFWLLSIILYLLMYTPSLFMALFLALTGSLLLAAAGLFIAGYRYGMVVKTFDLLGRLPLVGSWARRFLDKRSDALTQIDLQIAGLHRQRRSTFYASFISEFTARFLTSAEIFFILKILTPHVNPLDCILIMAFTSLFANIFFFSPMQLGAREGGFAIAVSGLCLSGAFGIYASLITRVREIIWIIIGVALMKVGNHNPPARRQTAVRGLLFDYGGTLDTGGRHWADVIWEAYRRCHVPVTSASFHEAYIHAERTLGNHDIVRPDDTFLELMRKKIHLQIQYLRLDNAYEEPVARYCYQYARQATATALPVLRELHRRYPMALVSNFYGNLPAVLRDFDLLPLFDAVIDSTSAGLRKPSAGLWQLGLDALHLTPSEACVIGDSEENDIQPALRLGCRAIQLKAGPPSREGAAGHTVSRLGDLPAAIDAID